MRIIIEEKIDLFFNTLMFLRCKFQIWSYFFLAVTEKEYQI